MLDVTSLVLAGIDGIPKEQAKLTFAMARHSAVDLTQLVNARYDAHAPDRLPTEGLVALRSLLSSSGMSLRDDGQADERLRKLRSLYEPYCEALGQRLLLAVPPWISTEKKKDNWQSGPWDRAIQAKGLGEALRVVDNHF